MDGQSESNGMFLFPGSETSRAMCALVAGDKSSLENLCISTRQGSLPAKAEIGRVVKEST